MHSDDRSTQRRRVLDSPAVHDLLDRFDKAVSDGARPRIEDFAPSDPASRPFVLEELIQIEIEFRFRQGEAVRLDEYLVRFPELTQDSACVARLQQTLDRFAPPAAGQNTPPRLLASAQLVFGIIALQNSFITREQLVAAFDAWVHDKSRGLAAILVSQGALIATDRDLLERLVATFLEKHQGSADQSLAALSSVAEVRPQLEQLQDADLAASLGHVGRGTSPEAGLASTLVPVPSGSRGRFRILRPHAQGGLGQVSVALDQELNREVALKEIQPRHADDSASRERFVLEAEITGGLEHPGIVPVYALGQAPDGRPFYAMRFVKGDSLKTAIELYHRTDNPNRQDAGARQLELRRLLGRFIDVCNAIDYAHSRGVLHRDLKPGNIMVGKYGETLVVDWGLAKAVGRPEIATEETSLRPTTALSSSGQTQPGSAVGTPAYMSPEQAAGDLDRLGPASDVYSLGATLYQLLCGQPPFERDELAEVLSKVQRGEFPRPGAVASDVPAPLESICLKAMSLNPADRYSTPRALADDVEHWLADEPVTAHADSASARVARWSRKHRGWVQAGSAAVILVMLITTIAAFLINEQRRHAAKLAEEKGRLAEEKGQLAETNRQLFASERTAKTTAQEKQKLAERQTASLKRALARNLFDHGIREYDAGRLANSFADLTHALALTPPEEPLFPAYRRVLVDRAMQGGKLLCPPIRHKHRVDRVAFSPDGAQIATSSSGFVRFWDSLTGLSRGEPIEPLGGVTSLAWSPDGSRILTSNTHGVARIWDVATRKALGRGMRHKETIWLAIFSPDGSRVATTSQDKTARLWDAATGKALSPPLPHGDRVLCAAFSPDGSTLATGGWDDLARLWDAPSGKPRGETISHDGDVTCLTFSPDSTRLLTGSQRGDAKISDTRTGERVGEVLPHPSFVSSVAFSPDGSTIATGCWDNYARLWDAATGKAFNALMPHEGMVKQVVFSPDGLRLATCSARTMRLWDAKTAFPRAEPVYHDDLVESISFSPDGARIVTASWDRTARVCDALANVPIGRFPHKEYVLSAAFSRDGIRLATASGDATARIWLVATGEAVGQPLQHQQTVHSAEFSPDGTRIVTASADSTARLWDATTTTALGEAMQHRDQVLRAAFSPDGQRVVTGSADKTARIWNGTTGGPLGEPMPHPESVKSVLWSPDGLRIATTCQDGVRIWDKEGKALGEPLKQPGFLIGSIAFNPDGTRLVTGCWDHTAQVWDVHSLKMLARTQRHDNIVYSVAFASNGKQFVTGSFDGTARLWDAETAQLLSEPMRHGSDVTCVAFNPEGIRILTTGNDTCIWQWDAATGQHLGEPFRHFASIQTAAFNSDGSRIVSRDAGYDALLWDTKVLDLEGIPGPALTEPLQCWTGFRPDAEQRPEEVTLKEFQELRRRIGETDPIARFKREQHAWHCDAWHRDMAAKAEREYDWLVAAHHLQFWLQKSPEDVALGNRLALAAQNCASLGRYTQAARAFDQLCSSFPQNPWLHAMNGAATLATGRREEYRIVWTRWFERYKETTDAQTAAQLIDAYVVAPAEPGLSQAVVQLAERHSNGEPSWKRLVGAAQLRDGQVEAALAALTVDDNSPPLRAGLLLRALAHARNNDTVAATKAFRDAEGQIQAVNSQNGWNWYERVAVTVLQRELAEVLKAEMAHVPAGSESIRSGLR